ncbi:MAG: TIR domain-containing protein [Rhodomicrobium sp.]|nr:TIR domain-containing protein [Rhodomicrobium sp.]
MSDIIVIYAHTDINRVDPFVRKLRNKGFRVVWDQDTPAGVDWDNFLKFNLENAICALVFLSENSVQSAHVKHEAQIVLSKRKHIPILLDKIDQSMMPSGYSATQFVMVAESSLDARTWDKIEIGIKKVMKGLPWVREVIQKELDANLEQLNEQIRILEEENQKTKDQSNKLRSEINQLKSILTDFEVSLGEVTVQNDAVVKVSKKLQDSLNAMQEYLAKNGSEISISTPQCSESENINLA